MPVQPEGLTGEAGERDFVMAWISVPDLTFRPYPQRYEHVRRRENGGSVVCFVDRGPDEGFVAELSYDADGIVEDYPGLATRL